MAINKIINVNDGSGREFTENTIAELKFDVKPEVGSFNAVTSDAVARAVAGASGEVPEVTESDNGKVLKAIYDEGGPAVEWGNAGSGVPEVIESDNGKILTASWNSETSTGSTEWGSVPNEVPSYTTSEDGKVLGVVDNSGSAELQWVSAGGGDQPLPAIPAYSLRFQFSDTSFDPTTPLAVTNGTWSLVDAGSGIWDFTYQNNTWTDVFIGKFVDSVMGTVYADVIGGDLAGVTYAEHLFADCNRIKKFNLECDISSLISVAYLFGQWNGGATQELVEFNLKTTVTDNTHLAYITGMFQLCGSLKKVSISINNNSLDSNAGYFLSGADNLTECTLHGFTGFRDPSYAFNGTHSLESLKIVLQRGIGYFNLTGDCASMFSGCGLKNMQSTIPVLGCSNVTDAPYMFTDTLTQELPMMIDTGSITDFTGFCQNNSVLRTIPSMGVSSATAVDYMFTGCRNVQSGALALYKQLSTKATPPSTTTDCFSNCGIDTASGNIELAKIPTSYGGLGYESASSTSVTLPVNDLVVSDSVDVTRITVASGVTSGIVQWVVNSTTTLPTVTDGTNPLKASVNNPASLTVGRTVQVSILNGTWVCAEFA